MRLSKTIGRKWVILAMVALILTVFSVGLLRLRYEKTMALRTKESLLHLKIFSEQTYHLEAMEDYSTITYNGGFRYSHPTQKQLKQLFSQITVKDTSVVLYDWEGEKFYLPEEQIVLQPNHTYYVLVNYHLKKKADTMIFQSQHPRKIDANQDAALKVALFNPDNCLLEDRQIHAVSPLFEDQLELTSTKPLVLDFTRTFRTLKNGSLEYVPKKYSATDLAKLTQLSWTNTVVPANSGHNFLMFDFYTVPVSADSGNS